MVILRIPKRGLHVCIRVGIVITFSGTVILTPKEISSSIVTQYPKFNIGGECVPNIVEDWQWAVMTIIQEAATESLIGKIMVAEVIRDRTETKYNSDGTIVDTILRSKQFSGWNTEQRSRVWVAKMDLSEQVVQDALKAYNLAFKSRTTYAKGANLYHADYMSPYPPWVLAPNVERLTQEGHHIFYKETR